MKPGRNILTDVVLLTLPLAALIGYLLAATAVTFHNAEIVNFHGDLVRRLRTGTLLDALRHSTDPLLRPSESRIYLSDLADDAEPPHRVLDLRIPGPALDALRADLVASGRKWKEATLVEGKDLVPVSVRFRGQMLSSFFWSQKAWKIKTRKRRMVDGYRTINLTPLGGRLPSYLGAWAGARADVPVPRVRLVRLHVNKRDQGLYVQEEQVDESMMRRLGRMPGDVFYGELFTPSDPKASSNELFWNPFLWEKHDRYNRYPEEYRPYLTELLDLVCDESPAARERLSGIIDVERYAEWVALLVFLGDEHVDHHHNHKLYFNPLTGRFEPLFWDPLFKMRSGDGVEPTSNRLLRALARDPRFADYDGLELNHRSELLDDLATARRKLEQRAESLAERRRVAEVRFETTQAAFGCRVRASARSLASLRLLAMEVDGPAEGLRLLEDRDGDGAPSSGDRELSVRALGRTLTVDGGASLAVGRDFTALYDPSPSDDEPGSRSRRYHSRLAWLDSDFLLVAQGPGGAPDVIALQVERSVGSGPVTVRRGAPDGLRAVETLHPWLAPPPPEPRRLEMQGTVELRSDLIVGERDSLHVAPGTRLLLGPGVSLLLRSRVEWDDVTIERLDPGRPWGVVALQGPGCSDSELRGCHFSGGSEDTLAHVYYSGMVSVHAADRVRVIDSTLADNVLGDDTLRFADCRDLEILRTRVERAIGDAIDCDLSSGRIEDVTIVDPRNDGIDLMTARVDLIRVTVGGAGDKGLSLGEGSAPEVVDCVVTDSTTGVAIKDGSSPSATGLRIERCGVGVDSYSKNWRYPGGGRGHLTDCTLVDNRVDVRLDGSSTLVLERCSTGGRFILPPGASAADLSLVDEPTMERP
jgi:hypothetical protein